MISRGSQFKLSKCSLVFTTETCSRDKIVCGENTIQIEAGKNFEASGLKLRIKLGPIVSTDSVWKDHALPVIEVSHQSTMKFGITERYISYSNVLFNHLNQPWNISFL